MDVHYQLQQQDIQQKRALNLRNGQDPDKFWSVNRWGGFTSTLPQTTNSNLYGSACINMIPEFTHVGKSAGMEAVGFFRDIDVNSSNFENLICGQVTIKRRGTFLWTIIYDKINKNASFYYIEDTNETVGALQNDWVRLNPKQNPNDPKSEEYRFKGKSFDAVQFRETLYICSGEENFVDKDGISGSVLALDLINFTWSAVPTGKCAKIDLSKPNENIADTLLDPQKYYDRLLPMFLGGVWKTGK